MGLWYAPWWLLCAEQAKEKETRHVSCQQRSWICAIYDIQMTDEAAETVFLFCLLFVTALFFNPYNCIIPCFEKFLYKISIIVQKYVFSLHLW
jgi:hypothetical protein